MCDSKYSVECKFIKHGLALSYDQILKPCCEWQLDHDWRANNHYQTTDLQTWHQSPQVLQPRAQLERDQWPANCRICKNIEGQGRFDSTRGNGNQAYAEFKDDDITLEIRPGNTCNFACQTCWPEASSRVAQYHHQAGLIDIKNLDSRRMDDFDFLKPIASRIKNVVLLGGEPFYDKSCKQFLSWAQQNLSCELMLFTNGSMVDMDFLRAYPGSVTVIFSLDAVGQPAEYIRYGTVWSDVLANYQQVRALPNVQTRVNITCSAYNYWYLEPLLNLLCEDWPAVVSFGQPWQDWYRESVIPVAMRESLILSLSHTLTTIQRTYIESGQKSNAINAVTSIINNLQTHSFDPDKHAQFCQFITRMDQVKNIRASDYCGFLAQLLEQKVAQVAQGVA